MPASPLRIGIVSVLLSWALAPLPVAAGEVRGRVLSSGRPVPGITVDAVPWESAHDVARREARGAPAPSVVATTSTKADGTFSLVLGPEAPSVALRIDGPGLVPLRISGVFDDGTGASLGDVRATEAASLSGRVADARGAPLANATVTLEPGLPPFGDEVAADAARTRTAADGTFRFERASSTGNRLRVFAAGYASASQSGVRAGVLARPLTLGPETILMGRVQQLDGRTPAAGALVRFEGGAVTPWVEAGPDGTFRLAGVPTGPGRVVADGGALGHAEQVLHPGAAPAPGLALILARPAVLAGRIVDASSGQPVPRARVVAHGDSALVLAGSSGLDGRYRLEGLAPGRYRVKVDEPGHVPYERDDVRVDAGATVRLDLPLTLGAALSGRVVDARGAPVAGATGRLARGDTSRGPFGGLPFRRGADDVAFRTGPDGTFKASRLAPGGNQQLTVSHPEFEKRFVTGLSLPAGGAKAGLTIVLRPGLELRGVVLDVEGRPVNGASLDVRPSASERSGRGGGFMIELGGRRNAEAPAATSGADGRFRVAGLSPGTYSVHVRHPGHADASQDPVKVEREEPAPFIELKLGAGAAIRGFVRRNDGSGARGYVVRARAEGGGGDPGGPFGVGPMEPTGTDGAFTIDGLHTGESYALMVLGPSGPGPRQSAVKAPVDDVEILVGGTGRIAGRVIDAASGEPITEFTVAYEPELGQGGGPMMRMIRAPRRLRRLTGDDDNGVRSPDGSFTLDDVPAGSWTVTMEATGYETARIANVVVRDSDTTADLEIRAAKGRVIRGRVVDARSGRPVVGATVAADEAGAARPPMPPGLEDAAAYTDADGRFDLPGLALGTWKLVARHPDYAEASQLVELRQNLADAEIRMSSGGDLGGWVVSEAGAPVGGASVAVRAGGDGGGGGFRMGPGPGPGLSGSSTLSDDGGHFRFDRLTAGRYSVTASLRGRTSTPLDVPLQAGESREDLKVALAAGATLHGRVSGLEATRYSSVNVTASGPESYFAGVRPGGDGTFTLGGVPDGVIELHAMAGDFESGVRTAAAQVQIAQGQTEAEAEIVFEPGGSLSGTVTRGGEGVAEATVAASTAGQGGPGSFARTDASGTYRLEGLKDGSYAVTASPPRGAPKRQTVEVAGDATLDFVLPLARLAGRVIEAGSNLPLAEAEVEVGAGEGGMGRARPRSTTDSNGRFGIEGVEPGSSTLTTRRTGYVYDRRTVDATEDATRELEIELRRGEGLGLRARDGNYGVPLHGLFAQAKDGTGAVVFGGPLALDSDGRGEVPSLKAGSYALRLDAPGYAPLTLSVSVPSPTLEVALTAGGSLEVRSGPETQARAPRARLVDAGGVPVAQSPFAPDGWVTLSGPGRTFAHLAPGSYTLFVEGGPTKPASVAEGGVAQVELP